MELHRTGREAEEGKVDGWGKRRDEEGGRKSTEDPPTAEEGRRLEGKEDEEWKGICIRKVTRTGQGQLERKGEVGRREQEDRHEGGEGERGMGGGGRAEEWRGGGEAESLPVCVSIEGEVARAEAVDVVEGRGW